VSISFFFSGLVKEISISVIRSSISVRIVIKILKEGDKLLILEVNKLCYIFYYNKILLFSLRHYY
jgi:hypothetical protein